MGKKLRLDELLVVRGLCTDREEARRFIMAGRVVVDDHRLEKAGRLVAPDASVRIKSKGGRFVGRGGDKLQAAIKHFAVAITGKIALDLGASTGGFTDCLLKAGAQKVYAVDVGTNQLDFHLRRNPSVVCLEKTHSKYLSRELVRDPISFLVADVSFTKLETVLPHVLPLLDDNADILALFKPQFQAPREWVEPGGLVTHPDHVSTLIEGFSAWIKSVGLVELGRIPCPIRGARGNQEWFFWLRKTAQLR